MIDDVRIVIPLEHKKLIDYSASPDGTHRSRRRIALRDNHDLTIRVMSVKDRSEIVVEGSFVGFLQGETIVGSCDLPALVSETCDRMFRLLKLKPTRKVLRLIEQGRIKLERVDIVGLIDCRPFGGPPSVLRVLDAALGGSSIRRSVYPDETLICDYTSRHSSTQMYYKAAQMQAVHPSIWVGLASVLQDIAEWYLRCERRLLGPALKALGVHEVRDFRWELGQRALEESLSEIFAAAKFPDVRYPKKIDGTDKSDLFALLSQHGIDVTNRLADSTRRRLRDEIAGRYGFDITRPQPSMDESVFTSIQELRKAPVRYGAPGYIKRQGLVWGHPDFDDYEE